MTRVFDVLALVIFWRTFGGTNSIIEAVFCHIIVSNFDSGKYDAKTCRDSEHGNYLFLVNPTTVYEDKIMLAHIFTTVDISNFDEHDTLEDIWHWSSLNHLMCFPCTVCLGWVTSFKRYILVEEYITEEAVKGLTEEELESLLVKINPMGIRACLRHRLLVSEFNPSFDQLDKIIATLLLFFAGWPMTFWIAVCFNCN